MKKMKYKQLSLLFLISGIIIGCNQKTSKKSMLNNNIGIIINSKTVSVIDKLRGKQLDLSSILEDTSNVRIVYLFNYYDCEICIGNGFKVVNKIDSLKGVGYVKAIQSRCPEVNSLQRHFQYFGYIFNDEKDEIRKILKYSPTPILLLLNSTHQICDVCPFYEGESDENKINQFIQKIKNF